MLECCVCPQSLAAGEQAVLASYDVYYAHHQLNAVVSQSAPALLNLPSHCLCKGFPLCSPLVRRASADVVSIIAKYTVPMDAWPGLLHFLFECSQSQQEDHREVRHLRSASSLSILCLGLRNMRNAF